MATPSATTPTANPTGLPAQQAYLLAAACAVVGLLVGYFLLGGPSRRSVLPAQQPAAPVAAAGGMPAGHPKLTIEQMKQMADTQTSALVEKSKADPKNTALLVQIASIYQAAHQFQDASGYYEKALKTDPKNVPARTQLASCLYYAGDLDGALTQLNEALKYQPTDANSLFNLGMIKYRGKNDAKGAVAAWQQLLRAHPDLDRKAEVEKMIAEAQGSSADKQ
jgi:cytochrome c-type biogenesis protein CcmH/NrfG